MKNQNFENHARFVPGYHFVTSTLLLLGTIGASINLWKQIARGENVYNASLILLLFIIGIFLFYFIRTFAVTVQDRAIRADENLRHYIITGKPIDPRITLGQIIALRFASDDELVELSNKAISESLASVEIKKLIKNWKADHHRA